MKSLLSLLAALLCSCVSSIDYTATAPDGGTEHMHVAGLLGGSEAFETAGGTRWTGNRNKSFGQGAQVVTAIAATAAGAYVNSSLNASNAATTQQANAQAAATAQAKIAADAAAADAAAKAAVSSEAIKGGLFTPVPFKQP